jgi:hypothetical protein
MQSEIIIIILLLISGCILLHATRQLLSIWLKIALLITIFFSVIAYTNYGKFHTIYPQDNTYKAKYGNAPKHSLVHWHEIYHYYLGGKYFQELGYKGLYETVAYADSISPNPAIHAKGLRSLRDPTHHITMEEGLRRGKEEFRPRFTEERWKSFATDLENMKITAGKDWLDLGLFDAGYNPPPSWAVIGTTAAKLIPLTQEEAWGGDGRPNNYQIEWLPIFDIGMLLAALMAVTWAFGWLGASAFIILFCLNEPASMGWVGGGFFRYTWLAELMVGLSCLKKRHYIPAGIFLALSTADRIFPAVFLCAAAIAILADFEPTVYTTASVVHVTFASAEVNVIVSSSNNAL